MANICVCDSLHIKVCRCVSVTCMYKKATSVFIFQSFNPMDVNGLMVSLCYCKKCVNLFTLQIAHHAISHSSRIIIVLCRQVANVVQNSGGTRILAVVSICNV